MGRVYMDVLIGVQRFDHLKTFCAKSSFEREKLPEFIFALLVLVLQKIIIKCQHGERCHQKNKLMFTADK